MNSKNINEIIGLILANEASEQEEVIFRSWLGLSEENKQHFNLLKQEWETNRPRYKVVNAEEIKDKIWKEGMGTSKREHRKHSRHLSFNYPFYLKIAAVFVFFISATLLIVRYHKTFTGVEITWVTKTNPAGQKSKVFLPDGSEVWLNANSNLRYLEKFTDSARVIYLQGEAFFSVVKDIYRPFIVISKNVSTTSLGTSFNVNAFKEEVKVALVSGKVKVDDVSADKPSESTQILQPGQAAVFNLKDKRFDVIQFNIEEAAGWKDGILYFSDTSFNDIINKLELWYDVRITLKGDTAIKKHYTGRFNNESLRNVLESMSFALDFEYELKDKTVEIYVD